MENEQGQPYYFSYGEKEMQYLKKKDPVLGAVIDELGILKRAVIPDLYEALLNSIAGQQISSKALDTVWGRIQEKFAPLTPAHLAEISEEELQGCGISMRKAHYMKEITDRILDGSLNLSALAKMSDEQVTDVLIKLPGIGVWTAEMLLIFSMQRPNVLSYGDLAIQRGMRMVYHHKNITPALFKKYKKRYTPYATVAGFYLWAAAGGAIGGMKDHAPKKK